MAGILLHTKFYVPPLRPDCVARPRLYRKLDEGLSRGCKVSLVCAPAGFGKTTLITEWLNFSEQKQIGWLSLDEGDSDLFIFMEYLVASLKKIGLSIDDTVRKQLDAGIPMVDLLAIIINNLAECTHDRTVLVFDDYHCIHNSAIHAAVEFFLENKPPNIHVILTTRQDPLLPLSRWRAKGQVNEIRLGDLRFLVGETADFLNHAMQLDLTPGEIAVLEARTEGWISGLQLAAITIQQEKAGGSSSDFVQVFAGDNRYIMDYLMDEVLSRQPVEVQSFLLKTSILTRMTASLCEALTNSSAHSMLAYLDRANLFIIPLDQQREWYRYHHLFAQLLQQRLINEQGDSALANLHKQAAVWFAAQGLVQDAVEHATKACDYGWLAELLEATLRKPSTWSRGEVNRLLGWLNKLPEAVIENHPFLAMQVARSLHLVGDTLSGIVWLQRAEASLSKWSDAETKNHLLGIAAANWATFHVMQGEDNHALESAETALRLLPEEDSLWRSRTLHAMALLNDEMGQPARAYQIYQQVIALARSAGNMFLTLSSMGSLAAILNRLGKLRQAEACCQEALSLGRVNGQLTPSSSLAYMAHAGILYERNMLDEAEVIISDAIALAETGGIGLVINSSTALAVHCWCRLGRGDRNGAYEILSRLDEIRAVTSRQWARRRFHQEAIRVCLALSFGDLAYASAWARQYEQTAPTQFNREMMNIALARVYLAEGNFVRAMELLERMHGDLKQSERMYDLLEIKILLAIAYARCGQLGAAHSSLLGAVESAAPEGYIRIFVTEGDELRCILSEMRKQCLPEQILAFIDQLLNGFPTQPGLEAGMRVNHALVDPLTERELEVLRFLAKGFTGNEIAQKLYLSPNTLKAHTNTIYMKLDVHSRLQAVNKGRALGLIDR